MQDELSAAPVDGGATYRAANRFGLPHLGIGVGLRSRDYAALADDGPAIDWLEVLSDNFLHTEGRPLYFLDRIAERYPVALHGVGMSLGSTDPLDAEYLTQLKGLRRRTRARWVSDHLSWSGVAGRTTHDLLFFRCRTPPKRYATW